jgi:hypothetical protein
MNFNVLVPVKPYVKRFVENNYGCPADFHGHPRENEMFRRMLKKPCYDKDQMYSIDLEKQSVKLEVVLSDRDFFRSGWEMSKTDIIAFGKYFERNAKWLMRSVVSTYISFGMQEYNAIMKFQSRFHMEEEYWPFDSIKKDFYRFKSINDIDFNHYAYQHLEKLILVNMCTAGAITNAVLQKHASMIAESA